MKIITCNRNVLKTNSYLIKKNNNIILIDPSNYDEIIELIGNCTLDYILLTHEHFDHIIAIDKLRDKYKCQLITQEVTSQNIQSSTKNLSKYSNIILNYMNIDSEVPLKGFRINKADITFKKNYILKWQGYEIFFTHTPGHSQGSTCILLEDFLFSGDSLFKHHKSDIKGPGADKKKYINTTIPYLQSLKKNIKVFPGHYKTFILKDRLKKELF